VAQVGPEPKRLRDDIRSIAQLNMLHNLAAALNMLGDAVRSKFDVREGGL